MRPLRQLPQRRALAAPNGYQFADGLSRRPGSRQEARGKRQEGETPEVQPLPSCLSPLSSRPVLILDTLGELSKAWGLADIAFVGGSLTAVVYTSIILVLT